MPESLPESVAFMASVPRGFRLAAELVAGPVLPADQSASRIRMRSPWRISLGRQGLDWSNQPGSSSGFSTGIHSLMARHGGRTGSMVSTSKGGAGGGGMARMPSQA